MGSGPAMSRAISAIAWLLAFGQFEGEQAADPGVDPGRGFQRGRSALVVLPPPFYGQGQLQHEKLLIHESTPRMIQTFPVVGKMNLRQGLPDRPEFMRLEIFGGKDLVEQFRVIFQCSADDLAYLPLLQAFGERVDGQDFARRLLFILGKGFHAGMMHLPHQPFVLGLARDRHALAIIEFFPHEGLVEPECA